MSENRASSFLQTSSQALVIGAGLVYLFGFIIVSIFDASYGIADFSLFRTKVIAVGTLFVFLIGLAALLTFRAFQLFGLAPERPNPTLIEATPQNRLFVIAEVLLSFPFACVGLALLLSFLFPKFPWPGSGYLLMLATFAITVGLSLAAKLWLKSRAWPIALISALNTLALFVILFRYAERGTFWFVVWLSLVCAFTFHLSSKLGKPEELRKTEWERLAITVFTVVFGLYATKVFPNIRHEFGGGAPVPIVLHLTKKLATFDSENVPVSLIDETEQGYYIIRGGDKAVFVARGLVEAVEFVRVGAAPKP
jgi:MFS family permease